MLSADYWRLFMDTGAPELYLLYHSAKRAEASDVFYDQSAGITGNKLQ